MWSTVRQPMQFNDLVARATLVVAPLLAFRVFAGTGGKVTSALVVPVLLLAASYIRTEGNRVPGLELLLVGLLMMSVLWGDEPSYSFDRMRTFVPLILATILAAAQVPRATVLRCLEVAFVVIIVSSLVHLAADPTTALRFRATNATVVTAQFTKNEYGGLLSVALFLTLRVRRRANLLIVPVLVVLLFLNRSVTAWVVVSFLLLAAFAARRLVSNFGPRAARPFIAVMIAAGLGGALILSVTDIDSAIGALGKDPTLGRRTDIWAACWTEIKRAPILGHGAFTFLDSASNSPVTQYVWSRLDGYHPPHPHNGLLDLWGELGVVGIVVFAALVGRGLTSGARAALTGDRLAPVAVLILCFILLFGITEPTYLGQWLVVTVMCVALAVPRAEPRTQPAPATALRRSMELTGAASGR